MAELFEIRIENLEKSNPLSVASRKKKEKNPKKRNATFLDNSEEKNVDKELNGRKYCKYHGTCGYTIERQTTLKLLTKQAK